MHKYFILFPNFNPIIFSFGMFSFHWYGLMYFLGLIFAIWSGKKFAKKNKKYWLEKETVNILYICFIGMIIGGRLGYIFLYDFFYYSNNLLECLKIWKGGMSFHGGLIGIVITIFLFSKKNKKNFLEMLDFITPLAPFGLGIGRIGNLINGELWGKINVNSPIYIFFPASKKIDLKILQTRPELQSIFDQFGNLPRYPSQIYEFFFEGIILFILLNYFKNKKKPVGNISGIFLIYYGIIRFVLEFFREPDIQLGLFYNYISMGQILSIPMLIIGIITLMYSKKMSK
ncbi:Phosphatidylglycerol--prolipoprotein diacylglyceryl transferase [Buchnera aphidicola (Eriosoma grossulariae)]|uniref:prolipoprotein diacylglyceryl transferase n=1 Tax=Buchnera aphidicola TaxID=9 RepID=UPI0034639567